MARTKITNVSTGALALPPPYFSPLPAGAAVVVADDLATVNANLGSVPGMWRTEVEPDSGDTTPVAGPLATADLADASVTSTKIDPSVVQTVVIDLTNAQIKAMKATPVTLVAAPGAGKALVPIECLVYLKYGGTNAFTANVGENLAVKRVGGANQLIGGVQAFIQGAASAVNNLVPANAAQASVTDSKTLSDNIALQIANIGAVEIAGNAANNNTMRVVLTYRVDAAPAGG
jgi:hypothetical protein